MDGIAIGSICAGSLLCYAAVQGKSVLATAQAIVQGKSPSGTPNANPITLPALPTGDASNLNQGVSATSSAISNAALKYAGHEYIYGGAPGPSGTNGWDCSSFSNWVLNHDLGLPIPGFWGGQWPPTTHGPATGSYLLWNGAKTIGSGSSAINLAEPGDLCVWQTHMGIAIGNGSMISALNESLGTRVTTIASGAPGIELLFVRRLITGSGQ